MRLSLEGTASVAGKHATRLFRIKYSASDARHNDVPQPEAVNAQR
jgi:hypothetical protein